MSTAIAVHLRTSIGNFAGLAGAALLALASGRLLGDTLARLLATG
jgi:hypothetical protein